MGTYRMTIEYDGTNYVGWQIQPNGRSIQEVLQKALQQITQLQIHIVGGGRTDAGVHAKGQVASFLCERELEPAKMKKGLNAVLPHDIVVKEFAKTYDEFHARYSAKSRTYEYTITLQPIAIGRLYAWELFYILNTDALHKCAELVCGTHSFEGFCKKEANVPHFNCTVRRAVWSCEKDFLHFTIEANRFLHGMVRALVGTMVDVARNAMSYEEFKAILENGKEHRTKMFAPAKGLCLMAIEYEEKQQQ